MATTGHLAAGLVAGRMSGRKGRGLLLVSLWLVAVSFLPDADVLSFKLGIPYTHPLGHRGFTHSLVFAFALGALTGLGWWALGRLERLPDLFRLSPLKLGLLTTLACASHGLLDMLTDGGEGIALLWPFDPTGRYFFDWRPIPVAPLGAGVFTTWGLRVIATEVLFFLPFLVFALWPRRRRKIFA